MGLGKIAQLLAALFVLLSGVSTLLVLGGQGNLGLQLGWATGVLGVLGGLAWLATAAGSGKK